MKKIVASGRALAAIVLATALVRVLFERMAGALTGIRLFLMNYGPDRLPAVSAAEREEMPSFSRCIACGRCDVGEGERMRSSKGAYPGLMALVLASSRSMPDYDAAARAFAFVPIEVLRQKRAQCPADVPFEDLARFVGSKAREVSALEAGDPSAARALEASSR
jgi:hypothetical protein